MYRPFLFANKYRTAQAKYTNAIRWRTPGIRNSEKLKLGNKFRNKPRTNMIMPRLRDFSRNSFLFNPLAKDLLKAIAIETPTINKKNGKIRSVTVHPTHSAWVNWP